ncbi:MAG TPA: class I SAM-dependent methyltransferase [Thermoanaerobaculia bacterium]|nr:class I SAM-dependent methyltransferase [Thermoanaerobaculia bacterium]
MTSPSTSPDLARLAGIESDEVRSVLEDCVAGEASPPVSLARLLLAMDRVEDVEELLEPLRKEGDPLAEMARLLREHRPGCEDAAVILHEHPDVGRTRRSAADAIADCRSFFDHAVTLNEEASVAAYSLGDPALLDAYTAEILDLLELWQVLGPDRGALEIGCGIGRIQAALAPRVRESHGIDISGNMIAAAHRRCSGLANVHLSRCSGRDLAGFAGQSFDLVLAADSFPYIYQGGKDLVSVHFDEITRVLRPGGDFVLFNYSYRASREADRRDVQRLCRSFGLELLVDGIQPFRLWDGEAYHIRRPQ